MYFQMANDILVFYYLPETKIVSCCSHCWEGEYLTICQSQIVSIIYIHERFYVAEYLCKTIGLLLLLLETRPSEKSAKIWFQMFG